MSLLWTLWFFFLTAVSCSVNDWLDLSSEFGPSPRITSVDTSRAGSISLGFKKKGFLPWAPCFNGLWLLSLLWSQHPYRVRTPRDQGAMPTRRPPSHHLDGVLKFPSVLSLLLGSVWVSPWVLGSTHCATACIPLSPKCGYLEVCKWSLGMWAGSLRPGGDREVRRERGIFHGLAGRALCSIMIGHRTFKNPRILTSNLAFHMVLKVYL